MTKKKSTSARKPRPGNGPTKKRDLFKELTEGIDALAEHRAGKRTLRTHTVKTKPAPKITARELAQIRKALNLSRGLFAGYLRTNVRTLENWEQGRAKPNAQAALLIRMVQRFPDMVHRLADI
jgi:putative transcriptional regulator